MSARWPDKYVIGLTGNIATGKSVVRKMLEHLGAYGIDADALSHRAIMKGAPGYQPVVDTFGKFILSPDGQIDRAKLGGIVFPNPQAMASLEAIVHPLVREAADVLVRRAKPQVIVIEAIKLLEGELRSYCDTIWVTDATPKTQIARLVQRRNLSQDEAQGRIKAQNPQAEKQNAAQVVIRNDGSFEKTWQEVLEAWQRTVPAKIEPMVVKPVDAGALTVQRAAPGDAQEIAEFMNTMRTGGAQLTRADVMAEFGEKAFLILKSEAKIIGLLGWQVENLVARVDTVIIDPELDLPNAVQAMVEETETASQELLCEAALLFLSPEIARHQEVWEKLGYAARTVKDLSVRAWQDAAVESMPPGTVLYFKQLRKDRVLRPV